jgi:hypothetical protein
MKRSVLLGPNELETNLSDDLRGCKLFIPIVDNYRQTPPNAFESSRVDTRTIYQPVKSDEISLIASDRRVFHALSR